MVTPEQLIQVAMDTNRYLKRQLTALSDDQICCLVVVGQPVDQDSSAGMQSIQLHGDTATLIQLALRTVHEIIEDQPDAMRPILRYAAVRALTSMTPAAKRLEFESLGRDLEPTTEGGAHGKETGD